MALPASALWEGRPLTEKRLAVLYAPLADSHLTRRPFGQILSCIERLTRHPT